MRPILQLRRLGQTDQPDANLDDAGKPGDRRELRDCLVRDQSESRGSFGKAPLFDRGSVLRVKEGQDDHVTLDSRLKLYAAGCLGALGACIGERLTWLIVQRPDAISAAIAQGWRNRVSVEINACNL